jgi:hypothetical protein
MDIEALLCDAATVRENVLHILGGGLGQLWRDVYPAPLGADLALLLTLHPSETTDEHELRILIQDADGKRFAQLDATFSIGPQVVQIPLGRWCARRSRSSSGRFQSPRRAFTASSFSSTSSIAVAGHSRQCRQESNHRSRHFSSGSSK